MPIYRYVLEDDLLRRLGVYLEKLILINLLCLFYVPIKKDVIYLNKGLHAKEVS
jgi:hypothetical protein